MKLGRITISLALLFATAFPALLFAAPPAGYYLVWDSEFDGASLDTTKWGYRLPGTFRDGYDTPNALSFNGSNLVITTYSAGGTNFTCELYTQKKFESQFGYWESSIMWSDSNGTFSAFWMLPPSQSYSAATYVDLDDPQVAGSEIDICEHRYVDGSNVNNIANYIQVNLHYYDGSTTESNDPGSPLSPPAGGLATGFHTYGFLWTASAYSFLIDGSQVYTAPTAPVSHSAEYVLLDTAVDDTSTTWAGYIPAGGYGSQAASATKMTVEYVRYYAPTNVLFWTGASSAYWNNAANWISNLPPVANADLTFSYLTTANLSMTPGQDYSLDGLIFLTSSGAFSVSGTNTLTLGAGGVDMVAADENVTLGAPINLASNQTWGVGVNRANNAGLVLTDNGGLSGSATLTKSCYGTLILNGTNSFSGTLNVDTGTTNNDGLVLVANPGALANASSVWIRNTNFGVSCLQLSNSVILPCAISLAGRSTNAIPLESVWGNNSVAGGLTLAGGGSNYLVQAGPGTLSIGGTISAAGAATGLRTLTLLGTGSFSISAAIQNGSASALSLVKSNSDTLTLSGASTYTGGTTNWGGTLFVNGSLAGPLAVKSGYLSGVGAVAGVATLQSGGELTPGTAIADSIGTLSFGSSLVLESGSTTYMEINAASLTNDQVNVAGTLNCGGTLYVSNLGGTLAPGQSFHLFSAGGYAGSFSSMNLPALAAGLAWNTSGLTNSGTLSVIALPEVMTVTNLTGGQLQLNWIYGTLQCATNVAGPYTNATGAAPPYDIPATNPRQFYRVKEE